MVDNCRKSECGSLHGFCPWGLLWASIMASLTSARWVDGCYKATMLIRSLDMAGLAAVLFLVSRAGGAGLFVVQHCGPCPKS